jgi:hypothetical protein
MRRDCVGRLTGGLLILWLAAGWGVAAEETRTTCELCGKAFGDHYFSMVDKVTGQRRMLCGECVNRPERCFACGLPIVKDMSSLGDGRHYCARDFATALLSAGAIQKVVLDGGAQLRRLLVNDMTFPERNVNLTVVDRVNIEALFASPGNDYRCPNILGYYRTLTNGTARMHDVYLLSGLTASGTRAVLAHELTHAWMADNLPAGRALGGDAAEGFCELIAYLLQKELHDEAGLRAIKANQYTRGQFELFRRAEEAYTLQSVIDWVKYGAQSVIDANDLDEVRRAQKPGKAPPKLWLTYSGGKTGANAGAADPAPAADTELRLKAVVGSDRHRTALVGDCSLGEGEAGKVKLARGVVEIRCLEIGADFVRIERVGSGRQETLHLGAAPRR